MSLAGHPDRLGPNPLTAESAHATGRVYGFNAEARAFYEAVGFHTILRKMRKPLGE